MCKNIDEDKEDPNVLVKKSSLRNLYLLFPYLLMMSEGNGMHRCLICGKILHDPLAIYCPECEYELKRVRLADEETVEEWMERMKEERGIEVEEKDNKQSSLEIFTHLLR